MHGRVRFPLFLLDGDVKGDRDGQSLVNECVFHGGLQMCIAGGAREEVTRVGIRGRIGLCATQQSVEEGALTAVQATGRRKWLTWWHGIRIANPQHDMSNVIGPFSTLMVVQFLEYEHAGRWYSIMQECVRSQYTHSIYPIY